MSLSYDAALNRAGLSFTSVTNSGQAGVLPDGRYRVSVAQSGVSDATGRLLASDYETEFLFFRGDANGDGAVNFDDLLILASNYNQSGRAYAQGDVNYDGAVNFDDLLILASKYSQSLAGSMGPSLLSSPPPPVNPDADRDDDGARPEGVLA